MMKSLHMSPALRRRNILALIAFAVAFASQLGVGAVAYHHGKKVQLYPALHRRNILASIAFAIAFTSQLGVGSDLLSLAKYPLAEAQTNSRFSFRICLSVRDDHEELADDNSCRLPGVTIGDLPYNLYQ
ncbi:uncharacterized protein BYT42DRAFT_564491 [Radiomyces spectabilis]|uniref:uncharacterized protein n=1 Tax=Radiomyces spectabilis TaxID=64574 RepID=UPI00221FB557|nr:uncharacterized protein BYT42DRAFT_564491 [Radiomyces spectabilis]KAI8385045.1 hypothetical protein BYT42DRAFT_564491 [Radiomyces spectabilis]